MSKYGVFSGPYFPVFSPITGKYGPEKTTYLYTFHTVDRRKKKVTGTMIALWIISYFFPLSIKLRLILINLFNVTGFFLYPLKTWENLWFSDVFRGHRKRPVAWNGLVCKTSFTLKPNLELELSIIPKILSLIILKVLGWYELTQTSYPANIYLFKVYNRNTRKWNITKVKNKNTRTTSLTSL